MTFAVSNRVPTQNKWKKFANYTIKNREERDIPRIECILLPLMIPTNMRRERRTSVEKDLAS